MPWLPLIGVSVVPLRNIFNALARVVNDLLRTCCCVIVSGPPPTAGCDIAIIAS